MEKSPPVGILRSNLTGAGNAITGPVVKWVEGVIEVRCKPTADTLQLPPGFVRAYFNFITLMSGRTRPLSPIPRIIDN